MYTCILKEIFLTGINSSLRVTPSNETIIQNLSFDCITQNLSKQTVTTHPIKLYPSIE